MAISTKCMEKLIHLHFYFHDTLDGTNPTAIRIAGPSKRSFGTTMMIDDPLIEGPETNSKLVGRAKGIYAFSSQRDSGLLLMVMNFAFLEGTYNGSALSVRLFALLGAENAHITKNLRKIVFGSAKNATF